MRQARDPYPEKFSPKIILSTILLHNLIQIDTNKYHQQLTSIETHWKVTSGGVCSEWVEMLLLPLAHDFRTEPWKAIPPTITGGEPQIPRSYMLTRDFATLGLRLRQF